MTCKNCLREFTGNYCYFCGQKKIENRLNLNDIIFDIVKAFNFDNGLLLTLKELLCRPKVLLNNFFQGKRKIYFSPIKYLILFITASLFINNIFYGEQNKYTDVVNSPLYTILSLFVFVPALSFFSFLTSKKYSYIENIVINLYFLGSTYIFTIVIAVIRNIFSYFDLVIFNRPIFIINFLAPIVYLIWYYKNIYEKHIVKTILISVPAYLISFLLFFKIVEALIKIV